MKRQLEREIRRHLDINLRVVDEMVCKEMREGLLGMRFICHSTELNIRRSIPLLVADLLWTENLPYIRQVLGAFYNAIQIAESKFQMGFGGPCPESNEFGFFRYSEGDIKGESYNLDPRELLLVYGIRPKVEIGDVFKSAVLNYGASKMIPMEHSSPREDTFIYTPVIIENRSNIRCVGLKVLRKDGEWWTDGDLRYLLGWWFASDSRALERR